MPRIHSIREVKFVTPVAEGNGWTWTDPRGYTTQIVSEIPTVDYYKKYFANEVSRARDQIKLCAELGHAHPAGGCSGSPENAMCEVRLARLLEDEYTPERWMLVRVDVPFEAPTG